MNRFVRPFPEKENKEKRQGLCIGFFTVYLMVFLAKCWPIYGLPVSRLFYDVIQPGTFFSSTGLGTMGWGFPASIGAKVARPDVPVVDIAGDGSFSMTENSLATAVLEDIPVIVFVLNNSTLGMVAQWQRTFYDRRMVGVDQGGCPDYVKLAESYGAQGIRAQSMDELDKAIKSAISSEVATVIDIPIDPEEDVLPFVAPGTSLSDMILPS